MDEPELNKPHDFGHPLSKLSTLLTELFLASALIACVCNVVYIALIALFVNAS
jgi:hypothetical protein